MRSESRPFPASFAISISISPGPSDKQVDLEALLALHLDCFHEEHVLLLLRQKVVVRNELLHKETKAAEVQVHQQLPKEAWAHVLPTEKRAAK